uniref:Ig-like domain-containing protein n=1 Tax=Gopherus agassizii TaxID=38772 RepID=A0A452HSW1_9SAUR
GVWTPGLSPQLCPRLQRRPWRSPCPVWAPSTAQKSTLTLDPPWSIVFKGESVTLTCSTSHPPGRRFTWYRNNKVFRSTEINSLKIKYAQENDAGRYQCQASVFSPSDPVQLTISNDWLILQVPYYGVFEGDPLCLRCYGWKGARVSRIRYYRDGADVTPSHVNSELSIKQARTRDSGKYHCTGSMKTGIMLTKVNSPTVSISVQALCAAPAPNAGSTAPIGRELQAGGRGGACGQCAELPGYASAYRLDMPAASGSSAETGQAGSLP